MNWPAESPMASRMICMASGVLPLSCSSRFCFCCSSFCCSCCSCSRSCLSLLAAATACTTLRCGAVVRKGHRGDGLSACTWGPVSPLSELWKLPRPCIPHWAHRGAKRKICQDAASTMLTARQTLQLRRECPNLAQCMTHCQLRPWLIRRVARARLAAGRCANPAFAGSIRSTSLQRSTSRPHCHACCLGTGQSRERAVQ